MSDANWRWARGGLASGTASRPTGGSNHGHSKLTEKLLDDLDEIADDGMSIEELCGEVCVTSSAWYSWTKFDVDPDLMDRFADIVERVHNGLPDSSVRMREFRRRQG